jgi:hypothetical protein
VLGHLEQPLLLLGDIPRVVVLVDLETF